MSLDELSFEMIRYRANHSMSQIEFAKECGLTQQTICNIENCRQKPNKVTLFKILNKIGR